MQKTIFYTVFILIFSLILLIAASAEMTSDNYHIKISVLSGSGEPTSSVNYQMNSTLSQSTPIMGTPDPPMSDSYDLYPGFWYTLSTRPLPCAVLFSFAQAFGTTYLDSDYNISCDSEPDGDIDGVDLADFLQEYGL